MADPDPQLLRLVALDADDLAVLSANLQDAVVRVRDLVFVPKDQRFALLASRFDWVAAEAGRMERLQSGVHFDHVLGVKFTGFDRNNEAGALNLLSVGFEPDDAPGGAILLTFSGGAAIRLDVECIDSQMRDTGPRWETRAKPGHAVIDDEAGAN